jgi:hypothetical protein
MIRLTEAPNKKQIIPANFFINLGLRVRLIVSQKGCLVRHDLEDKRIYKAFISESL